MLTEYTFFGLQEKLESILGGVGWEQSGFLQRSQITDTFQLGKSSDKTGL